MSPGKASIDGQIAALASKTHGVTSRTVLLRAGLDRRAIERRTRAGTLIAIHDWVYAVGHYRWTPEAAWSAALLLAGDRSMLLGRAGIEAHGWLRPSGRAIEVSGGPLCKTRKHLFRWPGSAHSTEVEVQRWKARTKPTYTRAGLRTAAPEELLLSLAWDAPDNVLRAAVRNAEFDGKADDESLRRMLGRGRTGATALRALLDLREVGATRSRTALEELTRDLLVAAEMPMPLTNVGVPASDPVMICDFYFPGLGLVVEADGPQHQNPMQQLLDREHDAQLAAVGITVVRFTSDELQHRPEVVRERLGSWSRTETQEQP